MSELKVDEFQIRSMAENYADNENSCYTNDYKGFIAGFNKCLEVINEDLANGANASDCGLYLQRVSISEAEYCDHDWQTIECKAVNMNICRYCTKCELFEQY